MEEKQSEVQPFRRKRFWKLQENFLLHRGQKDCIVLAIELGISVGKASQALSDIFNEPELRELTGKQDTYRGLALLPRPPLQKVIDDNRHKLAQGSPLSIRNPLKLSFGFPADPHTYGIRTILHRSRLQ